MVALLLETSGRSGWVSLIDEARCLGVVQLDQGRRHARDLAPAVGKLLVEQGLKSGQVEFIAVSQGPGSYTGLRVGIASALAFRFATGCHLQLVPTFEIVAQSFEGFSSLMGNDADQVGAVEVIGDALKGWVYHQGFIREQSGVWLPGRELAVQTTQEWEKIRNNKAPVICSAGGGEFLLSGITVREVTPNPEAFAMVARSRAGRNQWDDSDIAEPLYLRPSSAELQMLQRQQETGK